MKSSRSGAILLIVLIVVLTISLLGTTLVALFYNVLSAGQIEMYRTQALYLAEAGLADAISMLRQQAGKSTRQLPPAPQKLVLGGQMVRLIARTSFGGGYYEVDADLLDNTLVSSGTNHGVTRTIQVKYRPF